MLYLLIIESCLCLVVVDESNTQVVENDKPTEQTQSWVSEMMCSFGNFRNCQIKNISSVWKVEQCHSYTEYSEQRCLLNNYQL